MIGGLFFCYRISDSSHENPVSCRGKPILQIPICGRQYLHSANDVFPFYLFVNCKHRPAVRVREILCITSSCTRLCLVDQKGLNHVEGDRSFISITPANRTEVDPELTRPDLNFLFVDYGCLKNVLVRYSQTKSDSSDEKPKSSDKSFLLVENKLLHGV